MEKRLRVPSYGVGHLLYRPFSQFVPRDARTMLTGIVYVKRVKHVMVSNNFNTAGVVYQNYNQPAPKAHYSQLCHAFGQILRYRACSLKR